MATPSYMTNTTLTPYDRSALAEMLGIDPALSGGGQRRAAIEAAGLGSVFDQLLQQAEASKTANGVTGGQVGGFAVTPSFVGVRPQDTFQGAPVPTENITEPYNDTTGALLADLATSPVSPVQMTATYSSAGQGAAQPAQRMANRMAGGASGAPATRSPFSSSGRLVG